MSNNDFGGKLRQARERRGISLRQIATSTKIGVAALEALERNDISRLPGGIFSRGFVRSYAIEVGLDPEETVREFIERFNVEPPPSAAVYAPVPEEDTSFESQQRMAGVILKLVVVSLVLVAIILYFTLRNRGTATATELVRTDPPADAAPALTAAPAAPVPQTDPGTPGKTASFTLELHPVSDCWIKLIVDGAEIMSRIMPAGERATHTVRASAVLEVGNAAVFAYSINGRPGRVLGETGQVKKARITPATLADYIR